MLARYGPRLLLGSLAIGVTYAYFVTRPPKPQGTPAINPMRTPGVKNIEGAYQSGGATATHTKAYGGTVQGEKDDLRRAGMHGTGQPQGMGEEGIGDDQRPGAANKVGEKFKDMKYGAGKDK
jgi:hypothetical protein